MPHGQLACLQHQRRDVLPLLPSHMELSIWFKKKKRETLLSQKENSGTTPKILYWSMWVRISKTRNITFSTTPRIFFKIWILPFLLYTRNQSDKKKTGCKSKDSKDGNEGRDPPFRTSGISCAKDEILFSGQLMEGPSSDGATHQAKHLLTKNP